MSRCRLPAWGIVVCLSVLLGTVPAKAQSSNRVAAEALFREARKLLAEEKYPEACKKLAASQELDPAVGTLLNLGHCYEKTGQKASAWETYREAVAAAKQSGQTEREKAARRAADALEPTLPQLSIVVPEDVRVTGLNVARDGVSVVPELWGTTVPVDPGQHTVTAAAPGMKNWSVNVVTEERATKTVTVPALERVETSPAKADVAPVAEPRPSATSSLAAAGDEGTVVPEQRPYWNTQRTLAVIFGAVGIGGGALAIVEALDFSDKRKASDAACNNCTVKTDFDKATELRNEARTASTIGIVSGAVGGASLITGVVLWFTAGNGSTSQGRMNVTPLATTDTFGVRMSGTW